MNFLNHFEQYLGSIHNAMLVRKTIYQTHVFFFTFLSVVKKFSGKFIKSPLIVFCILNVFRYDNNKPNSHQEYSEIFVCSGFKIIFINSYLENIFIVC